jgi:hypothetical protein
MIELTAEAKARLNEYLERMRSALRGTRAVEPEEVEQNVREHVDIALAGIPAPVGSEHLARVLEQLGPPEGWLPDDDRPLWKRITSRIMTGPEDWRLAYLSFAITFLMFLFFPLGGPVLLIPAYIVARAHVEIMSERGEALDARRWLVLPPIFIVVALICGAALIAPIAMFLVWGNDVGFEELRVMHGLTLHSRTWLVVAYSLLFAGAYWILLAGLYALLFHPLQSLIKPFGARWKRGHAWILVAQGAAAAGLGGYVMARFLF